MDPYRLLKSTFCAQKFRFKDHIKPDFPVISNHISNLAWSDPLSNKGHLGIKRGKGFYDYYGKKLEDVLKERDGNLLKILKCAEFCLKENMGKRQD